MVMTKQESAAKARAARAAKLQAEAEAGFTEATGIAPTSYAYIGGMNDGVVVVIDGTNYEFRPHQPVHLAHPVPNLDSNPEFVKVN